MHTEAPEFKRCCFCLPLRWGLIGCGYTKLGLDIMMIVTLSLSFNAYAGRAPLKVKDIVSFTIIIIALLSDVLFNIIFTVAGHMKNIKLLKVSYVYNFVWLGVLTFCFCYQLYSFLSFLLVFLSLSLSFFMYYVLMLSGLFLSIIFIQVYIILLIRSEMKKLQNQTHEMQFTNHVTSEEPVRTLRNAFDADACTGEN